MEQVIAAIDQGTTSTRCILFDAIGKPIAQAQKEHRQIYPRPGWVEHDPLEIWDNTQIVIREALDRVAGKGIDVAAVGITNQRETTILWDRNTGKPLGNAIVWQDTRTKEICDTLGRKDGIDRFRSTTGLPLATYFSGPKLKWMLENVSGAAEAAHSRNACFGTIDSWLIWCLTGGVDGGVHVTDVTNASRTMLMDLNKLTWDPGILAAFGIPAGVLPEIVRSSSRDPWGLTDEAGPFGAKVPVCAALGDQQAALVGQVCFEKGQAKNTYGTGCFLLLNTGSTPVKSEHGLITTVAYEFEPGRPVYALEGSIAIAGALIQWLRDNLGLIERSEQVEALATSVEDNGGVYIVPAFSGLFAPHWRSDARGVIVGLTRFANRGHLARASLEATAFQTREVVEAMEVDAGISLSSLKVDGGMVYNDLLMQFQADLLGVPVVRPGITETTALGAAYAAGLAVGFWPGLSSLKKQWAVDHTWQPSMSTEDRSSLYRDWKRAVERTFGWVTD